MRTSLLTCLVLLPLFMTPQLPGDRPTPNPRATRSVVMARNGVIATSQPLASAAGLKVLMDGGNAIDAAVTAAAVLSVVEPTMNGIGGDLFAIVYDAKTRTLKALNASGRAGAAATPAFFAGRKLTSIPYRGELSVSVPGVVDGWSELLVKHGTITMAQALAPAVGHARDGYAVAEVLAHQWANSEATLARDPAAARTFLVDGRAPKPGEIFRNPNLAASLEAIAKGGRDAFYKGELAARIVKDLQARDGILTAADLAAHHSDWVETISTNYRGYDVHEMPPNTQGIVALEMLNILEGFDLKAMGHNSGAYLHHLAEAKRIAFADRNAHLAAPDAVKPDALKMMLSKDYAAKRRAEINPARAARDYAPGGADVPGARGLEPGAAGNVKPAMGDTIYLTVADRHGNVVSLIQSIYESFGSGIVAGDTGIVLHNRGSQFSLDAAHPNVVAPGKRPFHTLVPAMVMKDGKPWLSFGVMGGDMQPQGHVQVLINLIDFGMNVQEAGEAPRFRHTGNGLALESAITPEARFYLNDRGHRLINSIGAFGGFQGILIDPKTGVLMGGSDPRKDGLAIGY
ncbi:MAG TPA: gamma-glutamyltransferase [Vicinamibacterales bacterium]|nr:gamma-glutamyltransferase [Vicinamibacterales bacterium]